MKPLYLNQLLVPPKSITITFYYPQDAAVGLDFFLDDLKSVLHRHGHEKLLSLFEANLPSIKKIIQHQPSKSHGFFLSEELQGYTLLGSTIEAFYSIGLSFHVRPLLEEFFTNPEFVLINVSLCDLKVYRGDFHHLEIIQHFEFDQLPKNFIPQGAKFYSPQFLGLIPFKNIQAIRTIARDLSELLDYQSVPVIVTGLTEMKALFLKNFHHQYGVISHVEADFYENTCMNILEKCKILRPDVLEFYSNKFKDRLTMLLKSNRLLSDLEQVIDAVARGRVSNLVLPLEKKLWGKIDLEKRQYEVAKKASKHGASVDILNELAEEVIRSGGKIQILAPHFFPENVFVMGILKGSA